MTDGVNIDWGLLKPGPDLAGDYANAFRAGRQLAQEQAPGAPNALTGAARLPDTIAAMSPDQKAAGAQRAEMLAAIGAGLAGRPYEERRALLAHLAGPLAARGLAPAAVAGFDPTDDNLAAVIAQAEKVRGLLAG
jgi:hypothetical protein